MKPYWIKTGSIIKKMFPGYIWDIPNSNRTVYLTFDDGPTPQVTEWVLDILKQHNIKATFFCIGNNIEQHPEIFKKVVESGHTIANHTFNHISGWNSQNKEYHENFKKCEDSIIEHSDGEGAKKLFRPPYGKIKRIQAKAIRSMGYKIIMWDVLSADFDKSITPQKCLQNVIRNTREGSVIIFHDSVKAFNNLEYALPKAIEYLKKNNFRFEAID